MKSRKILGQGMSVIEVLVVVLIFAVIATLATESLLLSLRGSKRSESTISVRENLNHILSIIERQIHNAESVSCPNATTISYTDANSQPADFTCDTTIGFVASSSARLTGDNIQVTSCTFVCNAGSSGVPPSVTISLTARSANNAGLEQQQVTSNTEIMLRTY